MNLKNHLGFGFDIRKSEVEQLSAFDRTRCNHQKSHRDKVQIAAGELYEFSAQSFVAQTYPYEISHFEGECDELVLQNIYVVIARSIGRGDAPGTWIHSSLGKDMLMGALMKVYDILNFAVGVMAYYRDTDVVHCIVDAAAGCFTTGWERDKFEFFFAAQPFDLMKSVRAMWFLKRAYKKQSPFACEYIWEGVIEQFKAAVEYAATCCDLATDDVITSMPYEPA